MMAGTGSCDVCLTVQDSSLFITIDISVCLPVLCSIGQYPETARKHLTMRSGSVYLKHVYPACEREENASQLHEPS
jgi:hypothetical protein